MMAEKKYYFVNLPNPNMEKIYDICVQTSGSIVKSIDGKIGIIKLKDGDNGGHSILNSLEPLTKDQIREQREASEEWQKTNI